MLGVGHVRFLWRMIRVEYDCCRENDQQFFSSFTKLVQCVRIYSAGFMESTK